MNRPSVAAVMLICTMPLHAQGQQPNAAELKANAQKVVSMIVGDKTKAQAYCQMGDLAEQSAQAAQGNDRKEVEALTQQVHELQKQLGPEYLALVGALTKADPDVKDAQEIISMFDKLDESCKH